MIFNLGGGQDVLDIQQFYFQDENKLSMEFVFPPVSCRMTAQLAGLNRTPPQMFSTKIVELNMEEYKCQLFLAGKLFLMNPLMFIKCS